MTLRPPPPPPRHEPAAQPQMYDFMPASEVDLGTSIPLYPPLPTQDQSGLTTRPRLRLNIDPSRRKPVPQLYSGPVTPVTAGYEIEDPESLAPPPWMVFEPRSTDDAPAPRITIEGGSPLERFPSVSHYPFQPQGLPYSISMAEVEATTRDHNQEHEHYEDEGNTPPPTGPGIDLGLDVDFRLFDALQDELRLPLSTARASSCTPPPRPVVSLKENEEAELKSAVRAMLAPSRKEQPSKQEANPATAPAELREMREI
ncbi:hypothetical protein BCV69DRAFT_127556 [Microstroma glucosiphilum]|uniref:Uncharacterized protein n=1 Tax=Pseudomicrostroma glucosiphilum TaxID=1684307 RepID=A0A316TZH0_9BASI|nr:hypothetical protein BCV69DRAFT_127556 [Pseudomicrostroma glucosiphilum]PWN17721.1 hypothetical protein BCV69DRAFT_127556 [Pseudomicrostroma glucosiphilum]